MNANQIKVIPLLVMVAMMAFSVRLIDFSLGVSSLSGAVYAAKSPEVTNAQPPPQAEMKPTEPEMHDEAIPDEEHKAGEDAAAKTDEHEDAAADPSEEADSKEHDSGIKWRDAKDESFGEEDVRREVMGDITERREALDQREQTLVTREALLRAAEQELNQKYKELLTLKSQIEELLDQQTEEEAARVTSLVKIYEGMKPKDAARIFDTLDLDVLVSVLGRMSERKLSPVLAAMNPERARTVTIMLAEEKKLPELPQ